MMRLKTAEYNLKAFPQVYEPSEDTFLFLDALEKDGDFLKQLKPKFLVEIGSGSGVVITSLAMFLETPCVCFATDINPEACNASFYTGRLNKIHINCVNMDLLSSFNNNLFDVILFNPPYVVTESQEIFGNGLSRAWAGGIKGREVIDRFLNIMDSILTESGVCYMVLLRENDIEDVKISVNNKFDMLAVMERKILGELLYVVKFVRQNKA